METKAEVYRQNKSISEKANEEYYKSKPLLKLIVNFYYIPYNLLRLYRYLRIIHDYKKNEIEIKVLNNELKEMKIKNKKFLTSPSDLNNFVSCKYLIKNEIKFLYKEIKRNEESIDQKIWKEFGIKHEKNI